MSIWSISQILSQPLNWRDLSDEDLVESDLSDEDATIDVESDPPNEDNM